ncbi:MAG: phosphoribosylanthranilate isomerase [Methylococcales bacterium]|jgi:phosphoribosylanthranilate isomerase|nr:phosphoribosylanthranilate isomerase [Methylococcales bacterium]MBT7444842.1 phosphoribosylanthranilate isomerase [Methylococcales bacterium]
MRTRVKICGITRPEDAIVVVESGADAIGLVFYEPSPRNVTIAQAQAIAQVVPPFVSIVGLFVNASRADIDEVLKQTRIDILQFHGDETESDCLFAHIPYMKAVRVQKAADIEQAQANFPSAAGILLDAYVKGVPGGTGQAFDWSQIPSSLTKPIILAGGLTPGNITEAVRLTKTYAVDVSGGVESAKGIKDHSKIIQFMQGVSACQSL